MFIGKEGEYAPTSIPQAKEKSEGVWHLVVCSREPPRFDPQLVRISGMICSLKKIELLAVVVGGSPDQIKEKFRMLGHNGTPAVLKNGTKEEMLNIGRIIYQSRLICFCYFDLVVRK